MCDIDEHIAHLSLIGYEKLTDHGLALPIYGRSQTANVFYTARPSAPGDPQTLVAGFDVYEADKPVWLPSHQMREVRVGERWVEVFLWDDTTYVGVGREVWDALADVRTTIGEHAPLSLLALAEGVSGIATHRLAQKAFAWLRKRHGWKKALAWRDDTYLRRVAIRSLRGQFDAAENKPQPRSAIAELTIRHDADNSISLILPDELRSIESRLDTSDLEQAAKGFGLNLRIGGYEPAREAQELIGRQFGVQTSQTTKTRTSESEIRIAALRVAASKPNGRTTTTELKREIHNYLNLTAEDRRPSKTRPRELMYQQIVGNIISHKSYRNNIFAQGLAVRTSNGIQITDLGREFLSRLQST
jgi:hypothetical protein